MHSSALNATRTLERFCSLALSLVVISFIFFTNLEYKRTLLTYPFTWRDLLAGRGAAPDQYRVGVIFIGGFLHQASHGRLALRYCLTLLDFGFLVVGVFAMYAVLTGGRWYRAAEPAMKAATLFLALLMLMYYLPWTLWYQKPETIANFAALASASVLLSGKYKLGPAGMGVGLVLVSAYLATVRADAAFALNAGMLLATLLPGAPCLPFTRKTQALVAAIGITLDLGIEFYIKHVLFPTNVFIYPIIQIRGNFTIPLNGFCFAIALAPYLLFLVWSRREWTILEGWERVLIAASLVELILFIVVALVDEVRLFLPFPMALLPSSAALFCRRLVKTPHREDLPEWGSQEA